MKEAEAKLEEKFVVVEIPPHAWMMLKAVFAERGEELPDPSKASILGVMTEPGGELAAFLVVQLVPHAEPLHIFPPFQGRDLHTLLFDHLDAEVPPGGSYFVHAATRGVFKAALRRGMTHLPGALMRKDILPEKDGEET